VPAVHSREQLYTNWTSPSCQLLEGKALAGLRLRKVTKFVTLRQFLAGDGWAQLRWVPLSGI
jgi:hypothetical protein